MGRPFLGPALLAGLALFAASATTTLGQTALPAEEFAGPFPSWNQVQCGGVDDTGTLQNALNNVGKPGNSPVLYVKPGTCRITSTLVLQGREMVSFLGADPATTRIVWGGPAGGTMFWINGVGNSRFGRITWDHNNTTGITLDASANNSPGQVFPTYNRHEDEVFTNLVTGPNGQLNAAVRLGAYNVGEAETTWIRERFQGGQAGLYLRNFNALNHWIWDSSFENLRYGVTNFIEASGESGAGGYAVNRSNFLNNVVDLEMGNTNFMSERWNYSRGAQWRHFDVVNIGSPINPVTIQGVQVYGAGDTYGNDPIQMGSPGPFAMFDSTFLSTRQISVFEAYTLDRKAEMLSAGNKFSNPTPYKAGPGTRLHQIDDTAGAAITDPGPPALAATPHSQNRAVFEPASKDSAGLQAAINQAAAAGTRAIVHLPYGTYTLGTTVTIPANATLQVVGDGFGATILEGSADPMLSVTGPSQPVLRDFTLNGSGKGQGLVINNANQPNGLVHFEDLKAQQAQVGLLVNGTNQTVVDSLDHQVNSTTAADTRATNGGVVRIFNGAGCCSSGSIYDVQSGSTIVSQNMYFENGAPAQIVAPNGNGTLIADVGKVAGNPGTAANASSFTGVSVLQNLVGMEGAALVGGTNSLLFGNTSSADPTDGSTNFLNWGGRHDAGGAATLEIPEQSAGVTDTAAFIRSHEAALRAAVPGALTARGSGVTDVRVYRVSGQNLTTSFTVTGSPGAAPAPSQPVSASASTTTTTTTASALVPGVLSANTSVTTSAPTSAGATAFVTGVTNHVALRNDYTGSVGAQITVGSAPLTITDLGRYVETGNSRSHTLGLYKASDSSLVASASLNLATTKPDASGFAYAPLSTSVTLPAGGVYYVVSSETSGGDTWEGWPSFPTLTHTGVATAQGGVWLNGSSFATSGTGSGPDQAYVPVSFRYQSGATSAPAATGSAFVTGMSSHGSLRNDFTGMVGAAITVGGAPVTISQLGRYVEAGNSGTHTLGLYKVSDGSLVAQTSLNLGTTRPDSTGFAYAPLGSSVTLPAGGVYYLVSSETSGGDTWEGWPSFPTLTHTSVASLSGAVWQNGSTLSTANTGAGADQAYVPVSFK